MLVRPIAEPILDAEERFESIHEYLTKANGER
jgi:hypothetical protein